jgi:hypothetical protein
MGGSARTYAMVAVAVIAAVAAPYLAPFIAEGLGTLIVAEEAAIIGAEGFMAADVIATATGEAIATTGVQTAATALSGAATGAVSGGVGAELAGQDPWTGAFTGAAAGAVGSLVSSGVGAVLPEGTPSSVGAGVKGAASGFTSAELKGKDLETALKTGLISGGTAGLTSALMPAGFLSGGQTAEDYVVDEEGMFVYDEKGNPVLTDDAKAAAKLSDLAEKTAKGYGGAYIRQNLSSLFDPPSPATTASAPTKGYSTPALIDRPGYATSTGATPTYSKTGTGASYDGGSVASTGQGSQGQPGSQALAQALRIGDPGAAIESPSQGTGNQQSVWNTASLRFKDETGSDA